MRSILVLSVFILAAFSSCSSKNSMNTNGNSISADEIIAMINDGKNVYLENKVINGVLDFTKLKNIGDESNSVKRVTVNSSLTFVACIFADKVSAYNSHDTITSVVAFMKNVSCIQCEFRDDFYFREDNFFGAVNFTSASFLKRMTFEGSNFMTAAIFHKTSFSDESRFQNVMFYNKANFMESIYGKTASFQGATFTGDAQFSDAKYLAYADFSVANFLGGCFFNYAEFSNQAEFGSTIFKGRAEFLKAVFTGNADFRNCIYYNAARMNECTINAGLSFQNATFIFAKPDLTKCKKTDQTKINIDNARVNSFQPLTEADF